MIELRRRGFLGLLAAPAIVRVASIMPVSVMPVSLLTEGSVEEIMIMIRRDVGQRRIGICPSAFRVIVEPVLRAHFELAYGEYDELDRG